MKKIIALTACMTLLFAGAAMATIPAPPVNQLIGFDDVTFNNLDEAQCRACHGASLADTHHLLYGDAMPVGECSENTGLCDSSGNDCVADADCPAGETCVDQPEGPCSVNADCATPLDLCTRGEACSPTPPECPTYHGVPGVCGQPVCLGGSAAVDNPASGVYSCLSCHEQETVGGVTNFIVTRDCTSCHVQASGTPTVHHRPGGIAQSTGNCDGCHAYVDAQDDGHTIPTYAPSLVTPSDIHHDGSTGPGSCDYCHNAGTDAGTLIEVVDNHDAHHGSGVYKDLLGNSDSAKCAWCHLAGNPHSQVVGSGDPATDTTYAIRTCENCHGLTSLHNIQVDSDGNGIVVGGESAGWGHVGANNPGAGDDCWGCHGFEITAIAPSSGPIIPEIIASSVSSTMRGTPQAVVLSGLAFTNMSGGTQYTSVVEVTIDGVTATIQPTTITENMIIFMLSGWEAAGRCEVRVVKDGQASGPVVIDITPKQKIVETMCEACTGVITITGIGFGDAPPAGAEEFLNVLLDGVSMEIISWSDTEIKIQGSCDYDELVVNTIFGSVQ